MDFWYLLQFAITMILAVRQRENMDMGQGQLFQLQGYLCTRTKIQRGFMSTDKDHFNQEKKNSFSLLGGLGLLPSSGLAKIQIGFA